MMWANPSRTLEKHNRIYPISQSCTGNKTNQTLLLVLPAIQPMHASMMTVASSLSNSVFNTSVPVATMGNENHEDNIAPGDRLLR